MLCNVEYGISKKLYIQAKCVTTIYKGKCYTMPQRKIKVINKFKLTNLYDFVESDDSDSDSTGDVILLLNKMAQIEDCTKCCLTGGRKTSHSISCLISQ